jgi:hypothetical protein
MCLLWSYNTMSDSSVLLVSVHVQCAIELVTSSFHAVIQSSFFPSMSEIHSLCMRYDSPREDVGDIHS